MKHKNNDSKTLKEGINNKSHTVQKRAWTGEYMRRMFYLFFLFFSVSETGLNFGFKGKHNFFFCEMMKTGLGINFSWHQFKVLVIVIEML